MQWATNDREVWLLWQDECWFSRFAQPSLKTWGQLHLNQRLLLPNTPEKAISYYGVKRHDTGQLYLYPCFKRPTGEETVVFLQAIMLSAAVARKKAVVIVWDNARWHTSARVKRWVRAYNHTAKRTGKPRLLICHLPKRSPWLNPIEPHWLHAKKRVCEPSSADLTPRELNRRVFAALNAKFIAFLSHNLS